MHAIRPSSGAGSGKKWAFGCGAFLVLGVLGIAALAAALYFFWLPSYAEGKVRDKMSTLSERVGYEVHFEELKIISWKEVHLRGLAVSHDPALALPEGAPPLLHVPQVTVHLSSDSVLEGDPFPALIQVQNPRIHIYRSPEGTSDLDPVLLKLEEKLSGSAQKTTEKAPTTRKLPDLEIRGGSVIVQDELDPSQAPKNTGPLSELLSRARSPISSVDHLSVRASWVDQSSNPGSEIDLSAQIRPSKGSQNLLSPPKSIALKARKIRPEKRAEDYWDVAVDFQPELRVLQLPGAKLLSATLEGIQLQTPRRASLKGITVSLKGQSQPLFEARYLEAQVQGKNLQNVHIHDPVIHLEERANGTGTLQTLKAMLKPEIASLITSNALSVARKMARKKPGKRRRFRKTTPDPIQIPIPNPDPLRKLAPLLSKIPREVFVHNGSLTWTRDEESSPLTLSTIEAALQHKLAQNHLQGTLSAKLNQDGSIDVSGNASYKNGGVSLKTDLRKLSLLKLLARAGKTSPKLRSGSLSVQGELNRASLKENTTWKGSIHLHGLTLYHPKLARDPLRDMDLGLGGNVTWSPSSGDLTVEKGFVSLEEIATFKGKLKLEGIGHGPSGALVDLKKFSMNVVLPPTDAQSLFEAFPEALRTELRGTKMQGEAGFSLSVDVDPRKIADMKTRSSVHLKNFDILSYNPNTDIRSLLGSFTHSVVQPETDYVYTTTANEGGWTYLTSISPFVPKAIRTNEDGSFYSHKGISWFQVRSTIERNIRDKRFTRGASTVSMQLVKNVFLSHEKTIARKLQELFLTFAMEQVVKVPKDRILEIYLNIVEWAPRVYGIRNAARYYFGKSPSEISLGEAVWLISILPGPRKYHSYYARGAISDGWWNRMKKLLEVMRSRNHVTQEEFEEAYAARPEFFIPGRTPEDSPEEDPSAEPKKKPETLPVRRIQRFDKDLNPISP